jgi:hypothetical protein
MLRIWGGEYLNQFLTSLHGILKICIRLKNDVA